MQISVLPLALMLDKGPEGQGICITKAPWEHIIIITNKNKWNISKSWEVDTFSELLK